ncbi:MAG TPA: hypothetical protein VEQ58_13290 [Polyangiaceae bacterium]|nr:hypothetical protein [Polyangiaceae bacterium]
MRRKGWWLVGVGSVTGSLLSAGGCFPDVNGLAEEGHAGSKGHQTGGASNGGNSSGGSSGKAGSSSSHGGSTGASAGSSATGGNDAPGASGETNQGQAGAPETCEDQGLNSCRDTTGCVDVQVGKQDGDGVIDCGACGTTCSLDHASAASCADGQCAATCEESFANCNADTANDGCETAIDTAANCGACGFACSLSGATKTKCDSGGCAPTCVEKYANCNATADLEHDDGCEVYLDSLDACTTSCDGAAVVCDATQVCDDGSCVAPSGVAVLSVPLPEGTDFGAAQRFADLFPPSANLNGASVTVRVYAPGATGGTLVVFVSDTASAFSPRVVTTDLADLSEKWTDITVPVVSAGAFDATIVKQVNIEVHAGAGPWTDPTVVYVDGVHSSNGVVKDTFGTSFGNMVTSGYVVIDGSTLGWADALP